MKIKVTMKDEAGIEKIQELTHYVISVDSSVSNVSSSSESRPSIVSSQLKSASFISSKSNLDNDSAVEKIRDFIANERKESKGVVTAVNNNSVKKAFSSQNKESSSDNLEKKNIIKSKEIERKKVEILFASTTQTAEVVSSEDSNHRNFIWKILSFPIDGFNLIRRLFYSGS